VSQIPLFAPAAVPDDPLLSLRFELQPRGKADPNSRRTGKRCPTCNLGTGPLMTYQVKSSPPVQVENSIHEAARLLVPRQLPDGPLTGCLCVLIVHRWKRPQDKKAVPVHNASPDLEQWRPCRPDFDNCAKLDCDALNGIAWTDDAIIVDGRSLTLYAAEGAPASIDLWVWRAPPLPPYLPRGGAR